MLRQIAKCLIALCCAMSVMPAAAQFNLKKAAGSLQKVAQAATLSDEQMTQYVKEYMSVH